MGPDDGDVVGEVCVEALFLVATWEEGTGYVEAFGLEMLDEGAVVLGYVPSSVYQYDCGLLMDGHSALIFLAGVLEKFNS